MDHASLGGVLLRRWGLPKAVAGAVAAHRSAEAENDVATYVRLADMVAHHAQGEAVDRAAMLALDLTPTAQSRIPSARTGAAMPKSTSPTDKPSITGGGKSATAKKTAATVLRHKAERRAESLAHIRTQTDDGSLVIRHMSEEEQAAASQAARATRTRNEARARRYRSPDER